MHFSQILSDIRIIFKSIDICWNIWSMFCFFKSNITVECASFYVIVSFLYSFIAKKKTRITYLPVLSETGPPLVQNGVLKLHPNHCLSDLEYENQIKKSNWISSCSFWELFPCLLITCLSQWKIHHHKQWTENELFYIPRNAYRVLLQRFRMPTWSVEGKKREAGISLFAGSNLNPTIFSNSFQPKISPTLVFTLDSAVYMDVRLPWAILWRAFSTWKSINICSNFFMP